MSAKILSAAVLEIDAHIVKVEAHLGSQLPSFATVGLPDSAVRESRERVNAAIKNSNLLFNLAPADIKKEDSSYDLPIAIAYPIDYNSALYSSYWIIPYRMLAWCYGRCQL